MLLLETQQRIGEPRNKKKKKNKKDGAGRCPGRIVPAGVDKEARLLTNGCPGTEFPTGVFVFNQFPAPAPFHPFM